MLFAATHISRYLPYFVELDNLSQSLSRHPSYEEVVGSFTVAKTREFLLVTLFLEEIGVICVDKRVQEEYANIDMIERYLDRFQVGSWQRSIMDAFSGHLHSKLGVRKSSIRSIRLALGTAAKFVQYCEYFDEQKLTNDVLHGFLWKYPGQRSSITGFVNFINKECSSTVKMPEWKIPELVGPKESHMRLKQQLIDKLREERREFTNVSKFFKISIECLHGVGMPNNVFIDLEEMKTSKDGTQYVRLAGKKFYLPKEISDVVYKNKLY
ncbi:hypothetical protein [Sulfurovum sp.]|uniref:hypothetical protein n=1 Tax=Sulfurovum sp. TaxID=1969726 RepID=UPI003561FEAC